MLQKVWIIFFKSSRRYCNINMFQSADRRNPALNSPAHIQKHSVAATTGHQADIALHR